MNILLESFPDCADINGQIIDFNCNYDNCIEVLIMMNDPYLTAQEKIYLTIKMMYDIDVEEINDLYLAYEKAVIFLNGGEEVDKKMKGVASKSSDEKLYCFEKDSKYIFSAVDKVLDGRLSRGEKIHWWLFSMAFMEIPEESMLSKIISLRSKKAKNKLSKEERKLYNELIDIVQLEVPKEQQMTEEEQKNADRFEQLMKRGRAND